ncbi:UNVERIFIED_CONTAM: hypothetical protein GTU68_015762, partial [Idotea baltica]|nr:hypothetical protein [Idotea baltica]
VKECLKSHKNFKGKAGETLSIAHCQKSHSHIVIVGLGEKDKLTNIGLETIGGKILVALQQAGAKNVNIDVTEIAAHLAMGLKLKSYTFDKYKTSKKDDDKVEIKTINVVTDAASAAKGLFENFDAISQGVFLARDLVNEPPNTLNPESYAELIKAELKPLGVDVEILDEKKMHKLGFGALLAVGQGSIRESKTVIMKWNGNGKIKKNAKAPIAFVGKGVTFDTGGISLKPGPGMDLMKMDMGGSAAVVGLMKALAKRNAKANVIGIVGLVENMPSDRAYRPGDVITSYSGKTIEVLNTDAEGRLVLADALTYIQETYKPEVVIDLATLTGAIMVALGH